MGVERLLAFLSDMNNKTDKKDWDLPHKNVKWTFEKCRALAMQYSVQRDFRSENKGAFDAAIRNGWMGEFAWLKDGRGCAKPHPTKWSYEACREEAKKYETRSDFMRGNESAYHKAREKGWIEDYNWFVDGNRRNAQRNTKWTYEACLELAKQCRGVSELIKKGYGAYDAARKHGWLKKYTWFVGYGVDKISIGGEKHLGRKRVWTIEKCREIALKYSVMRDFKNENPAAFAAAKNHGWLNSFFWLRDGRASGITRSKGSTNHSHPKYSNEQIVEAAKKYTKKADFLHNDNALYHAALHRGLMPQFTWLQSSAHLYDSINYIYRYFFASQNAVYVGRTINPEKRDCDHRRERGEESSTVLKFAQENGISIPQMEILENGLSGIESQIKEDEYVKKYRNEGMRILNKGATGLGRGSMGMKKRCSKKKFLEAAHRYETVKEFMANEKGLFATGRRNGWLRECPFLKRANRQASIFSKEYCFEIAKACKTRKELAHKDPTVYNKMRKNGWIDECNWIESSHKDNRELTYDFCMQVARQYSNSGRLSKEQPSIYKKMNKTGWIDDCDWFPFKKLRPISKFSLQGELIETYPSVYAATKSIVSKQSNIAQVIKRVCKGQKESAYGYKWQYADKTQEDKRQGIRNAAQEQ